MAVLCKEATVGRNSRLRLKDGCIGWDGYEEQDVVRPTGPYDPDLYVLALRHVDGRYGGLALHLHQHWTEVADNARELRHLFQKTDPHLVSFCIDVHWVHRGGQEPVVILEEAGGRIGSMHLRNSREGVIWEDFTTGDIDYEKVARCLQRIEYAGLLTVELWYEKTTRVTRSREENLRISRDLVFLIGALCTHGNVTSSEEPLTRLHLDELPFGEILDPFGPPERKWSYPGGELQVAGRLYERGLGVHAPSRLEINLDGRAVAFEAWVGVDGGNRKPEPRDSDRKRKVIAPYFTASTISLV